VRLKQFASNRLGVVAIGFTIGLLIFISANVVSYRRRNPNPLWTDLPESFGFPFTLHASSGFGGASIIWSGLIANVLIALCGSLFLGLVAGLVFKRLVGRL
jgi:hypothetical protein